MLTNGEISAGAVRENLKILRSCAKDGTKLCPVVKCNAYGHGLDILLPVLSEQADWLAVATPVEAVQLRDLNYTGPLLVLFSPYSLPAFNRDEILDDLLNRNVTLTVVSHQDVDVLLASASRTGQDVSVHVMVDTGMTRSGVLASQAGALIERVRNEAVVRMTGIYTHLATADQADKTFARQQISLFEKTLAECKISDSILRHAANSAGSIDLPESHFDMLRPGISVFGYQPSDEMANKPKLQPAMRLVSQVMQKKLVPAGSRCGYGLTFECNRDSVVGLVPIGYGDGYFRSLSNRAEMRIGEKLVPVIGRVSMDQTILDLTDLPAVELGDEVEIISPNPAEPNSVENLTRLAETIPHELVTCLGHRVRRVLVD